NPTWRGLTWGLLPLHSSGITACTYHLFYNRIPVLVPLQALLTCIGNSTAAIAAYRIARSNGWCSRVDEKETTVLPNTLAFLDKAFSVPQDAKGDTEKLNSESSIDRSDPISFVGFEDIGAAWSAGNDFSFIVKLFVGCAVASYLIKYGEIFFDFPYDANDFAGLGFIVIPSGLNAYKWYQRGKDPSFEGWF
ncbi:MAG: DUF2499 domain-containing protein, partial [Bacteroidota bacterium]